MPARGDGGRRPFRLQTRPVRASPSLMPVLAAALAGVVFLGAGACSRQIGDDCSTAADCEPNGSRVCDRSQPGGYCTILNCDERSCPSEAACIRFFPAQYLTKACNPACEDLPCVVDSADGACPAECGKGPTNDCNTDEICLDAGICAPRTTERRYCMKTCGDDGDCRGGYQCRPAGTQGSMAFTENLSKVVRFCAPAD
jgi:hypothetical protein